MMVYFTLNLQKKFKNHSLDLEYPFENKNSFLFYIDASKTFKSYLVGRKFNFLKIGNLGLTLFEENKKSKEMKLLLTT